MSSYLQKLGFTPKTLLQFIVICFGSQVIYSINALRSVLYIPLLETLGVTNAQFGFALSLIGIVGTIFAIPSGWIHNRFSSRQVLSVSLLLTGILSMMLTLKPGYLMLLLVFGAYGLTQEAFYWASVLKSVRNIAPENKQGTALGLMETVRGSGEFLLNLMAVVIFTVLGSTLLGMKMAMLINSVLILLFAILTWFCIPDTTLGEPETKVEQTTSREALRGLIDTLKMPEVWLVGIVGSGGYVSYIGIQYSLPFMQKVYGLPVTFAAIFGLFNTAITKMLVSPISGAVGDNVFKSNVGYLKFLFSMIIILTLAVLLAPRGANFMFPSMIALLSISALVYLVRAVYYAPIGEMGVSKKISGSAMSVSIFLVQSPMLWGYTVYGGMLDKYPPEVAYQKIFTIMITFAAMSLVAAFVLHRIMKKRRAEVEVEFTKQTA